DVDAEVPPGQLRRVLDGSDPDLAGAAIDRIAVDRHLTRKTAMNRVVAQQMRTGLNRRQFVDADDLDIRAGRFGDRPQDVTADASETVDGDAYRHVWAPVARPPVS